MQKKKSNIEKIAFKVVQMKSLAMHITNQKSSFDIFMVRNLQNIFMKHESLLNILWIFGIKEKSIILTQWSMYFCYNVFLAIATNIPQWLKTGFVVQGHISHWHLYAFLQNASHSRPQCVKQIPRPMMHLSNTAEPRSPYWQQTALDSRTNYISHITV